MKVFSISSACFCDFTVFHFQPGPFWILLLTLTKVIEGQKVNIELRSKGDPPKSLQQKIQKSFISETPKEQHAQDKYIVQFYPSQVHRFFSIYRFIERQKIFIDYPLLEVLDALPAKISAAQTAYIYTRALHKR